MNDYRWFLLSCTGMIATFALGYILHGEFPVIPPGKEVEAMSALGTVAAVVVALYFGLRADAEKRDDREARAQLAAAIVHPDLERFAAEAKYLKEQVLPYRFLPGAPRNVPAYSALENKLLSVTPQELRMYVDVHPKVGVYVAQAISRLRAFEDWRKSTHVPREKKSLSQQMLEEVRAKWSVESALHAHAELRDANKLVESVLESVKVPPWFIAEPEDE